MHNNNEVQLENNLNDRQFEDLDLRDVKMKCRQYNNYHVIAHLRDGSVMDGIIEDMDDDGVTMLLPEEIDGDDDRQFGGYNGYGSYGGYGRRRFRRFRRRRFPFSFFLFPFFRPYPYYYPY